MAETFAFTLQGLGVVFLTGTFLIYGVLTTVSNLTSVTYSFGCSIHFPINDKNNGSLF